MESMAFDEEKGSRFPKKSGNFLFGISSAISREKVMLMNSSVYLSCHHKLSVLPGISQL